MFTGLIPDITVPRNVYNYTWLQITQAITTATQSDILNSMLSLFFRACPYTNHQAIEQETSEFLASFEKELAATQGDDRSQAFDYRCWFGTPEEVNTVPLFPGCPNRAMLNRQIREIFEEFKASFDNVILPRASRRHMSDATAKSINQNKCTGIEYLRHYHFTGRQTDAPMELRQVWRFNDLTPRTYFAQGSRVFNRSMFAQEIFNTLVDMFEVSHRRRRFDLNRLDLDEEDDVWIYDYSSFTSNCTEQKYFLDALAIFCEGTSIRVFDVFHGVQIIDLGVYLKEYNDECNRLAEFYLGPKIESLGIPKATYNHKRAGALGVLGNIASCTILHALLNMMITGSARKSSVVGDDGILLKKFRSAHESGEIDEWLNDPISIRNALRLFWRNR